MQIKQFAKSHSKANHQHVIQSNSFSNIDQIHAFNNPETKCNSIQKTNFNFKSNAQSIKIKHKKIVPDLFLTDSKKTKVGKTTNVCSSKTARYQKSNLCEGLAQDQPRVQQRLIEGILKKYKHKKYQKLDSPDEDKIATSQLLNENISHEFQSKGSVKRDKECKAISAVKFEEKLEGWIMRTTLKEKPLKNKMYGNRLDIYCEQNKNQQIDLENMKNLENKIAKNKKKNCSQILANKFLKNLEFKYSNNFKGKLIGNVINITESQSLSKIERNKSYKNIEIEENQKQIIRSSRVHRNRYEQKKQRKKVPLTFTTIIPDIQESFKNVRIPLKRTKKVSEKGYLNVRINHHSFMSRSESQYKKESHSQRKRSEQEFLYDNQLDKFTNSKLDKLERHVTIDHSELSRMLEDQKDIKMQRTNTNVNYSSAQNLENMSMKELKFKNNEQESVKKLTRNQKKQKTKLKFKNLQNLQSAHFTPLYPISKNAQEATKIFRPDNKNNVSQQKESLVQRVIRAEKEKQRLVGWEERICQRGGQNFYHLRSLLKQQHIDPVHLGSKIN